MAKLVSSVFIPELWSARLLNHLDKTLVFGNIVNNEYAGEIKGLGDTVKINQVNDITVTTGTSQTETTDPIATGTYSPVTGTQQTLCIDQFAKFAAQVSDILAVQANVNLLDQAMQRAAYGVADKLDQFVAGMYTDAGSAIGDDTTPIAISAANVYENCVALAEKLDEKNVPTEGRFIVIPPAIYSKLLLDDRFVKTGASAADARLASGYVGEVCGMKVYKSNNVAKSGQVYKVMAGHPMAITFAKQIHKVESYRDHSAFADDIRGLVVFGAKTVQANALATLSATV